MIVLQFAPRASKVGQGMVWRHLVSFLLAVLLGSATVSAAEPSANVQAALVEASKVMQKGAPAKAIEIIDNALRSWKVESELASKAMLLRGEANEKLGRTAWALSDYNSAIWMGDLSGTDKKRAEEGKARVTKQLGVAAPKVALSEDRASEDRSSAQVAPAANAAVEQAPAQQSTDSPTTAIGSFFNNLFGSPSSPQRPPPPREEPPPTAAAVTAPPETAEPPPSRTQRRKPPAQLEAAVSASPASDASAAPKKVPEKGDYAIQLAAVPNEEDKAIAEVDRLAKRYKGDLEGRTPSLMIVPTSDGGTLYKIVLAPFETRVESLATCESLKLKGLSCMVIRNK